MSESQKIERPEVVEDQHLQYLDKLRKSGIVNMWGAGAYLEKRFNIEDEQATVILSYWMKTSGNPTR